MESEGAAHNRDYWDLLSAGLALGSDHDRQKFTWDVCFWKRRRRPWRLLC